MDPRGRPFDGTASVGVTGASDIKPKPIEDGLSLRSDSIGGSDGGVEDALGNRQKLADEETSPASKQFPVPPITVQPRVQLQTHPPTISRGVNPVGPNYRHPYVNVLSPGAPLVARGGRSEVNVEWSKDL
jgi:hypothetical protein